MRRSIAPFLLAIAVAACAGEEPTADPPTTATSTPGEETGATPETTTTTTTATATTAASDESPAQGAPVLPVEGAPPLLLITESGGGTRPIFEWAPVPGAETYIVVVTTAEGAPYWSGWTSDRRLPMGGAVLGEDAPGPRIDDGYRWVVYALDRADLVVSSSEVRTISP